MSDTSSTNAIEKYESNLPDALAKIAKVLRVEINKALPDAPSKVWHGHPVWFEGGNPIVGYDARKSSVHLLFWNGQALGDSLLTPVGKQRAAGVEFSSPQEIDCLQLRQWLTWARSHVFDSVTFFKKARAAAGSVPKKKAKRRGHA